MTFARAGALVLERSVVSVEAGVWPDLSGPVDIDASSCERIPEIRRATERGEFPRTEGALESRRLTGRLVSTDHGARGVWSLADPRNGPNTGAALEADGGTMSLVVPE